MPRGVDTAHDPNRRPLRINPVTGKPYMGHITGDIRDTPESNAAYDLLARSLVRPAMRAEHEGDEPEENRYWSHPDEDPEQDRIERKQEQYRREGGDWGI